MNGAIEAFEREFAPWALKLPADDVAARRSGQLRANGWSVLYEFGSDSYGEYLDYYAALREATDARVHDDWHARLYDTGQILAFPAVLEAYLYGRDPSPDELQRARAPVIASLEPPPEDSAAAIGTADTALWEDLKDVVEQPAPQPAEKRAPPPPPRRASPTPAYIANVLDDVFGGATRAEKPEAEKPEAEEPPAEEPVAQDSPVADEATVDEPPTEEPATEEPAEEAAEPEMIEAPAPRRSAPGYDPFVELRTLEPKSSRRAAPTSDDFRPYWQRYPARTAGIAGAIAAVVLIAIVAMSHGGSAKPAHTLADTSTSPASAPAPTQDTTPTPTAQDDTQPPAPESADTASAPAPAAAVATPASSQAEDNSVARPLGRGNVPQIKRASAP